MPSAARTQLHALTGLRFIAAFQVLVFHCVPWATTPMPTSVRNVAGSGYVAVSLFFVLSGFILTYAHGAPGARTLEFNRFYVNRFARVYPAYAFALALVAPFYFVHTIRTVGAARLAYESIPVATLLQAWMPGVAMAWNPPGWSLSAEAFFYALFPIIAPPLMAAKRTTAAIVGVACYALSVLLPLGYMHVMPDGPIALGHETMAFWLNLLRYGPPVRLAEFVIGIVFARFYLDHPRDSRSGTLSAVASVALTLALVAVLANADLVPYLVLHNGLLAPLFALLIVSLAAGRGPVAAFLSTRPMVALGDASYSLYLLHIPLVIYWSKMTGLLPEPLRSSGLVNAAFLVAAVGGSLLCHKYVELPMRDRVLKMWAARVARLERIS